MYNLLQNIISIETIKTAINQAYSFSNILLNEIKAKWYTILIFILPSVLLLIFLNKIDFSRGTNKEIISKIFFTIFIYLIIILFINISFDDKNIYNPKNLYYNINNSKEIVNQFGLLTDIRLDIQRTFGRFEEKQLIEFESEDGNIQVIDQNQYNMLDINFDEIEQGEYSDEIKEISKYLRVQSPSNKNEYTGIYKGKNLIVFVAESFSNLAIRQDLTPTLYKIANSGFVFSNFYTPLFPIGTADGEYLTDTSLLPSMKEWSIENVHGKTFPYVYGNVFKNLGYKTFAYHNYNYDYYKRNEYFPTMGYDIFLANGNGLENRMDFSNVPSSDYDMVKCTIDDYIDEEQFVAYYVTMSGHMNYDFKNGMVYKNWNLVKNMNYSDKAKSYLATQIELDRALEELINRLKKANKLEDTVIVITGDHYPYGLTFDEMNELTDLDMKNEFNRYKMPFIVMNGENEENIIVDKYSSSLDVLPTMLNLFGIEFDSRLLMGRDIFSDVEPLIIFSDRSFITKKGKYNSLQDSIELVDENNKENIKEIKEKIYLKYRYSRLILENDFYKYIKINK